MLIRFMVNILTQDKTYDYDIILIFDINFEPVSLVSGKSYYQ